VSTQFDIDALLNTMAAQLRERLDHAGISNPALVGIRTGGVWVAERLRGLLGLDEALGELNIAFYRDDFSRIGIHPTVEPSVLPFDVDGRDLVLVDDVLYTGRTVRAALDALNQYGRPAAVQLAVMIDRGHRELPIRPDFVGKNLPTSRGEEVTVSAEGVMLSKGRS